MVSSVLASRAIPMAARSMRGVRHAHVENTFDTVGRYFAGTEGSLERPFFFSETNRIESVHDADNFFFSFSFQFRSKLVQNTRGDS